MNDAEKQMDEKLQWALVALHRVVKFTLPQMSIRPEDTNNLITILKQCGRVDDLMEKTGYTLEENP